MPILVTETTPIAISGISSSMGVFLNLVATEIFANLVVKIHGIPSGFTNRRADIPSGYLT